MPALKIPFRFVDLAEPGRSQLYRNFEEIQRKLDGHTHPADEVTAGTFPAGDYTFPANLTVTSLLKSNYGAEIPWLEVRNTGGNAYIDFTRTPGTGDYNMRLVNDAANVLRLSTPSAANSTTGGRLHVGNAYIGSHPVHGGANWAGFGHENRQGTSGYQFLANSDGSALVNAEAGEGVCLRWAGSNRIRALSGTIEHHVECNQYGSLRMRDNWIRSYGGVGWYNEERGGGVWMPDTTFVEVYGSKRFRVNNRLDATGGVFGNPWVQGGDCAIWSWQGSGGHALAGNGNDQWAGYMCRNDGHLWMMMRGHVIIRQNEGNEYFRFYKWGDVRFAVPTVAPGDPDLRIAGSDQLLRNSSRREWKKNIVPLDRATNPVWDIPVVTYHWKDDSREHGLRFNERHPRGCPGFIAEDLHAVAPSACTVDSLSGEPNGPDTWVLLAYLVAGVQELNTRLRAVESVPSVASGLKNLLKKGAA